MEAPRLEKFGSPGKGRGLRALRRGRPGDLLFRSEPLAYTVCRGSADGLCEHCLQRNENLLRCSRCKVARYCGSVCQKQAWQDHKRECSCLQSSKPRFPPDSVRLLGKVVFKLLRETSCPSEKLYSFSELESNIKNLSEEKREGLGHLAVTLQLYLKEEIQDASQLPPGFDILESFAKVICNGFTISNGEMQEVGVGLYPSMSLLNHSCDPNCVIVFEGTSLFLRAVREIQTGEELTICYLDVLLPSQERQKQLKEQYCFACDCIRCKTQDKDVDMLAGEEPSWKEVKDAVDTVEELQSQKKWERVLATCQALINNHKDRIPDRNIYQLKMLDCAMDACINLSLWEDALLYGRRTLDPYRLYYPGFHPIKAIQVMKIGKLLQHQGMFREALETLKEAFDLLKVTHGRGHSLTEELLTLLGDCEASLRATE
ncbi:histone-lysine N-methyltransferase SMYD3 isoform X1 [Tachyglossus aculeatus]|uniref:histone-lysine N-methyltransferase SMYD3 isoform X1 n=3 Tax=Tachyglossus aculeatus TaxID=9261 RepID=UPI0018F30FEE|nr:histone-lysine N-methyltransferase SMYD3 isoform X1 [Tachyglossus aculeatus]XP_038617030.1 histone-lysine N-methyltransferase SMYD3 isoform X1 [Tachyglossus aculeatus]XP_038617031.1 histone-lysine N-methyltransferase SMYD3 isoform X1 [Tachyglossus aculeatus]XP_038617032.1 histone-lysine N-methyltransferase SMYD3 isoform X1 [Tachyglossus aculeatus]XP_038617034.1 histone-lysine N-methyltransferase SMYD3 isoform X1 [Tachyglossus aculeatus]XP_038617035.1 histone-lysine N-methyltransferase SMYD3